jgi:hypothetical protein
MRKKRGLKGLFLFIPFFSVISVLSPISVSSFERLP